MTANESLPAKSEQTADSQSKAETQSARALRTLVWVMGGGVFATLVFTISFSAGKTLTSFGTGLMVSGAALLLGGLLGFLFGIPRTLQNSAPATGGGEAPGDANGALGSREPRGPAYQANTNLEQISDWLTKILVGVGLTQVRQISSKLNEVAGAVAWAFGSPYGNKTFALALIVFYLIIGFLFSYLWTRLYLPGAFREADLKAVDTKLNEVLNRVEVVGAKADAVQAKADAVQSVAELGVGKPQSQVVQKMLMEVSNSIERGPDPDDPWKGAFGGQSESNGRRLSATVTPVMGEAVLYNIHLSVSSTNPGQNQLSGAVQFFVHPTFKEEKPLVKVGTNGTAELDLVAWGAFTVGALADNGQTRLELDLSQLESAPLEFRQG